jgi:5'-nucleotidase
MADGTPSDCVKLALETILKNDLPELVISGINRGPNLGSDVLYSGTVSAAIEGSMYGIPSIATSLYDFGKADFSGAARFIADNLNYLKEMAGRAILNINFPAGSDGSTELRFTKLGRLTYENVFEERKDPRGRIYYWMAGEPVKYEQDLDSDIQAVDEGFISITPIKIDLTDYSFLQNKPDIKFKNG